MSHDAHRVYGISVISQDSICGMALCNPTKKGKHVNVRESRILQPGHKILDSIVRFECPERLFQKKGQKVRGVSETRGYRNVLYTFGFACRVYGISALGSFVQRIISIGTQQEKNYF